MCAWRTACFTKADLERLRGHSLAMGTAHGELHWGNFLWTHLRMDHVYFLARKWRILSKFSCFARGGGIEVRNLPQFTAIYRNFTAIFQ